MNDVLVTHDSDTHVATVKLNRPPNNYFDRALIAALADAVLRLEDEPEVRVIVLGAEGKHFCAGRDFSKPAEPGDGPAELYAEALRLFDGTKPIVAAVDGAAIGGGLGLAMAADFRVVGPRTRFTANFAKIGYFPGFGLTATLTKAAGGQRALEMLYTGDDILGAEIVRAGLADEFAGGADVDAAANSFAARIAMSAPASIREIRSVLRGDMRSVVEAAAETELQIQLRLRVTEDFREAQVARKERRSPRFTGE